MAFWLPKSLTFLITLVLGSDDCANDHCEPGSLLQIFKGGQPHFTGTVNETKKILEVLKGATGLYPYNVMTCPGEQTVSTKRMTSAFYDEIANKLLGLYNQLDTECEADSCPQAEWSGCVLRLGGHDFMDYNPETNTGGSNGCVDLNDPDNGGLASCLYSGAEFGLSVADAYVDFCTEVSLADFLVIAAQTMIEKTRQNVIDDDPSAPSIKLKDVFKWGRDTATSCPEATGVMPNPEKSCGDVERVFVKNMGLSWKQATALMGVHTLGRCRIENSGYDGWWSNVYNAKMFNNNYYIAIGAKGWVTELKVNGNKDKNQWVLGDKEKEKEATRGKEMMLNSDLCLAWCNDGSCTADLNAATAHSYGCRCAWMGPLEAKSAWVKYNKGKFCGQKNVPDDFPPWTRQREICCGVVEPYGRETDCGEPDNPRGRAWKHVKTYMSSESEWLNDFKPTWTIAITNGFEGKLKDFQ